MSLVDLVMPKLGESIMEATILKWHKKPGDSIKQDETVLDIATDKVDSEVPSTAEGVIEEILFKENDVVPIGTVIARIRAGANAAVSGSQPAPAPKQETYEEARVVEDIPYQPTASAQPAVSGDSSSKVRFYSPLVLNIAQQEGIGMAELENIPGTGQDGRVSKKDILAYVANKATGAKPQVASQPAQAPVVAASEPQAVKPQADIQPPVVYSGNVEVIEM
ncbi:MAG TPA: E3 binding domain-containing protein, partial [Ferruginibacter sp.]|nr:E3 binding domain-containing protein [Ferruginibacter sp.]